MCYVFLHAPIQKPTKIFTLSLQNNKEYKQNYSNETFLKYLKKKNNTKQGELHRKSLLVHDPSLVK